MSRSCPLSTSFNTWVVLLEQNGLPVWMLASMSNRVISMTKPCSQVRDVSRIGVQHSDTNLSCTIQTWTRDSGWQLMNYEWKRYNSWVCSQGSLVAFILHSFITITSGQSKQQRPSQSARTASRKIPRKGKQTQSALESFVQRKFSEN